MFGFRVLVFFGPFLHGTSKVKMHYCTVLGKKGQAQAKGRTPSWPLAQDQSERVDNTSSI